MGDVYIEQKVTLLFITLIFSSPRLKKPEAEEKHSYAPKNKTYIYFLILDVFCFYKYLKKKSTVIPKYKIDTPCLWEM